ncbi:MAG: choice-of-anchor B family protein [Flavobacteriales bacterium]|nr:choice-of-anchor B family protein [Flavobacteriales bacterium]
MRSILAALLISSAFLVTSPLVQAQVTSPCESGFAGIYPCNNYDLVGLLDLNGLGGLGNANDIWGWTDPVDGKEYALVGLSGGTAFVDISSPTNPVLVGTLPTETSSSTWRDIKVYQDHAFIVSEAGSHGMQVFDLSQLRTVVSPPITFSASANYNGFGSAHNIVINEESGYAYGVGARTFDQTASSYAGGLHFVDISDPLNPTLAGGFSEDGYTHDAQVVNYIGPDPDHQGEEIAFASNEDTFTIVDVTDKSDPTQVSRTGYTGSAYTHQGWATEDHRFYLMNDELDENANGHNTRTYIWFIGDLDNPVFLGFYDSNNSAIDHNLYIKGDLAFQSNYSSGLRVLDITDIANGNLSEVGYFDVYPPNDNLSFNGSWSNYPYFESGNIIVTSQSGGLFIVKESTPQACPAPSNVLASNITTTSALLTWDDNAVGISNGFEIEIVLSGTTPTGTGVSSSNAFLQWNDGQPSTSYDVYVRTDCSPIDMSFWVGPYTFSTGGDFCSGEPFVDNGGVSGFYGNNESETYLFCADEPGGNVRLIFNEVDIEVNETGSGSQDGCWDFLSIYDGPDTNSPVLAQTLCGEADFSGQLPSDANSLLSVGDSFQSTNGCLTVTWSSDASVTNRGWIASITCLPPPGPDCSLYATAPVDLTKSQQPVPFPNGDIDRVQVKWYKDSPQVKYSAQDSSAADIEFWAIRDLVTNTPIVGADTSLIPQRTKTGQDLFKWPIKFIRPDIDPNTRYRWRVRTYCQEGAGPVSPWSAIKIFNTPDFDPSTGIYTPPGSQFEDQISKSIDFENNNSLDIFPNPGNGNSLSLRFDQTPESMLVEIFDFSGKLLYNREITTTSTDGVTQLNNLNVWHTGLYLVSVRTSAGSFRKVWSVSTTE